MMNQSDNQVSLEKSVWIHRPVSDIYHFWRYFENLPQVFRHLKSVQVIDDRSSHWVAGGPGGTDLEWDSEITSERENELISWRSSDESAVPNIGSVQFKPEGEGTRLTLSVFFIPPSNAAAARAISKRASEGVEEDLNKLKRAMENCDAPKRSAPRDRARIEKKIDEASQESFPASDPPAW